MNMQYAKRPTFRHEVGKRHYCLPLAPYTTWRVGGPARLYFQPASVLGLSHFLQTLPKSEPLLWLGLGSNLLVRDGGFPGTVIGMRGVLDAVELRKSRRIWAGAGIACAKLARLAARADLCGLAFLAGIPGTLGGALAMNAGAYGAEIWERVSYVQTIDRYGMIHYRKPEDYRIGYRHVQLPAEEWFLGCELQLEAGDAQAERKAMHALLQKRNRSQPIGQASAGSTFRNPPGDYAARLIEQAGLKGMRVGGAQVSPKHANFIVNTGQASAYDIETLIQLIQQRVKAVCNIELQPEVRIVGVPA